MAASGFALFETAIGQCGIGWAERGVVSVQLPDSSPDRLRARLRRRVPGGQEVEPTAELQRAVEEIVALIDGAPRDLSGIALDMEGVPPFEQRVYALARAIAPGQTRTYGELATELGDPGAARAVGQAMGRNPFPLVVPCHRVLAAGGQLGGFSAPGGTQTKQRLLRIEGALPEPPLALFDP
ncbi:MAG TPA: methylated-DNA--[protein]-cysteine S-methyltransferase [Thermoleophilaceae bacterium]